MSTEIKTVVSKTSKLNDTKYFFAIAIELIIHELTGK